MSERSASASSNASTEVSAQTDSGDEAARQEILASGRLRKAEDFLEASEAGVAVAGPPGGVEQLPDVNVPRPVSRGGRAASGSAAPSRVRVDDLDPQLLRLILKRVATADVRRVCSVCKSWNRVAGDEQLWHLRARLDLNASVRQPWCATWREAYQDALSVRIGDAVEVKDMYGLWVTGRVMARLDPLRMLVYFEGWSDKWLVWIDRERDRERIRPLGTDEGDCPGLGSGGPLGAASFAQKCGAAQARLGAGFSQWPPPAREHGSALPSMYQLTGRPSSGRPGSSRPSSARRGPVAFHTSEVDGSVSVRICDAAKWQRQQQTMSRRAFQSCREIAAATYVADHPETSAASAVAEAAAGEEGGQDDEDVLPDLAGGSSALTLDAQLIQAPAALHHASGGEAAARNPYKVGQVLELRLDGVERSALPELRGASALASACLTGRVMVRLNAELFLLQCEGWRHDGLVWLHAQLDAHRIAPIGPDGPRGVGDDGAMTAGVFERLQFGIMMLLSQGTSYWDAPELLAAQWSEPSETAPAGGHVPPGLHSKSFRDASGLGMGLGFDLASPGSSARTRRRPSAGALSDAPSDCLPVPETVAGAYAAGYRRETLGTAPVLPSESGEGAGEQQQRAVGQAMSPRAPAAGSPTRPTRRGSAGNHPLESGPSGREVLSVAVSGFDEAGGGAGQKRLHDPNRLALYQHSNHGLEIRLQNCEQWRAEQERPPFRSCFQLWGMATARANKASRSRGAGRAQLRSTVKLDRSQPLSAFRSATGGV